MDVYDEFLRHFRGGVLSYADLKTKLSLITLKLPRKRMEEDPCLVEDSVNPDSECGNPIVKRDHIPEPLIRYSYSLKKMQRWYDNQKLIAELKRLTKSTEPRRHYNLRPRKGGMRK